MENEQTISSQEIDKDGGWVITHWTKTWDTRLRLDRLQAEVDQAALDIIAAEEKHARLQTALDDSKK